MKSIRLNKTIKDDILEEIKNHINKKYETNQYYIEYTDLIKKFKNKFLLEFVATYGNDLTILKKWNLGEYRKEFFISINTRKDQNIVIITSVVFQKNKWIHIPLDSEVFFPLAKNNNYRDASPNYAIKNIIEKDKELMELCNLLNQIKCDLETEKGKILHAYDKILSPITTTKALIKKHPEMEKYITFLFKDQPKPDLTENEKIIQKFETEKET